MVQGVLFDCPPPKKKTKKKTESRAHYTMPENKFQYSIFLWGKSNKTPCIFQDNIYLNFMYDFEHLF